MLLLSLLTLPLLGVFIISADLENFPFQSKSIENKKKMALSISIVNFILCLFIFIFFDFSYNQFQFVLEPHSVSEYPFYLGLDGISIYFVLLTTFIMPITILSNWTSISHDVKWYLIIMLLLETLLLAVFMVLDIFLFYIFFESILPPLFILIGLFGSSNKVRASFYLFLYTLLGSLFLLLSILVIYSVMGTTDLDALYKINLNYSTQFFLFCGIFIAFAVKTPVIFLNTWLLKAHVESPLGGSILLAAIVLKLSLYGILRLILPILPKASLDYTFIVYLIGVITIVYASFSTLRTIDIKELIAYSSVSHAAVYVLGVFSNTIQGIEGGITLGLAHGFVSSGLFICAGGVLYDRSSTRLITFYRGVAQIAPLFSILFFILCLGNAGTPLTLNFIGEFLCLYGTFERLPILGALASSSIVLSAAYTMFMFNRIAFAGKFSKFFKVNIPDLNKREFLILLILVLFTVVLGIYPAPILDGLHYGVSNLIYSSSVEQLHFESGLLAFTQRLRGTNSTSKFFKVNIPDVNKREFARLFRLVLFTVVSGVYPSFILDGLHYVVSTLNYSTDVVTLSVENVVKWNTHLDTDVFYNSSNTYDNFSLCYAGHFGPKYFIDTCDRCDTCSFKIKELINLDHTISFFFILGCVIVLLGVLITYSDKPTLPGFSRIPIDVTWYDRHRLPPIGRYTRMDRTFIDNITRRPMTDRQFAVLVLDPTDRVLDMRSQWRNRDISSRWELAVIVQTDVRREIARGGIR